MWGVVLKGCCLFVGAAAAVAVWQSMAEDLEEGLKQKYEERKAE